MSSVTGFCIHTFSSFRFLSGDFLLMLISCRERFDWKLKEPPTSSFLFFPNLKPIEDLVWSDFLSWLPAKGNKKNVDNSGN